MAKIIETQLHPDGDRDTVLYPETSVEQIVGFNDKVADIIDNSVESKIPSYYAHNISIRQKNNSYFVFLTIITNSYTHLSFGDVVNYLQKSVVTSCTGIFYDPERRAIAAKGTVSSPNILIDIGGGIVSISSSDCYVVDNPVKL